MIIFGGDNYTSNTIEYYNCPSINYTGECDSEDSNGLGNYPKPPIYNVYKVELDRTR